MSAAASFFCCGAAISLRRDRLRRPRRSRPRPGAPRTAPRSAAAARAGDSPRARVRKLRPAFAARLARQPAQEIHELIARDMRVADQACNARDPRHLPRPRPGASTRRPGPSTPAHGRRPPARKALRWWRDQPCAGACLLEFRRELVEERRVGLGVHFAAEHLRRAGNRERRDFLAERVARAGLLVRGLAASRPSRCARSPVTARFLASPTSSFERLCAMSTTCTAFWRASVRIASEPCRASASSFWPFSPAAMPSAMILRRSSIAADQLAARSFIAIADEDDHRDRLPEQCQVEIHRSLPTISRPARLSAAR